VYLDSTGVATIDNSMIDNGSTDNCTITTSVLDKYTFNCNDLGDNTVTMTVSDVSENSATNTAIVTVIDSIKPTIMTQDITVYLDANGKASIDSSMIDNGSADNCNILTIGLDVTDFFCTDLGENTITMTVMDAANNSQTATAVVTLLDTIRPIVIAHDTTLYLDANGMISIDYELIINGLYDNCGVNDITLDVSEFTCENIGDNMVIMAVSDVSNNITDVMAIVSVLDTLKPIVITKDITVYLSNSGDKMISASEVDNGSTDNCYIQSMDVSPNSFDCSSTMNEFIEVTLTVIDSSGNMASKTARVTVLDSLTVTDPQIENNSICEELDLAFTTQAAQSYDWTGPNGFTSEEQSPILSNATLANAGMYHVIIVSDNGCAARDSVEAFINPKPVITLDEILDVRCFDFADGSINMTVNNGTGFSYLWNNSASTEDLVGLDVGNYIMSASNMEGCTNISDTLTIEQPPLLTLETAVTDVTCFGQADGIIVSTITGGNDGYAYTWKKDEIDFAATKDLSLLSPGIYELTINDAKDCSISAVKEVTEPDQLILVLSSPTLYLDFEISGFGLNDGMIVSEINGGTEPYQITWNTGQSTGNISNLIAGDYYVEVSDSLGCTTEGEMSLKQPITLLFASAVTPNGDGINDNFIIKGVEGLAENNLRIIDQFGGLVFEQTNYQNNWKGLNLDGQEVPEGTYFYIFQYNDSQVEKGHITLKRQL
jgi:gliding motility-associated-like protein